MIRGIYFIQSLSYTYFMNNSSFRIDLTEAMEKKEILDSKVVCSMDINKLEKVLETNSQNGITTKEANRRRDIFGANELEEEEKESLIMKFLEKFKEPLVLLLLASAIISLLIKQYDDAISITLAIIIVCTVAFVQEYRSEETLEALKKIVTHKCQVLREGIVEVQEASDLVPGLFFFCLTISKVMLFCSTLETEFQQISG
jgi:magnesium-transporting ATPase (P-type)